MAYAVGGFAGGFALMARTRWLVATGGVVLTAHAMLVAAYVLHDACHDTIFRDHRLNRAAGELMSFVAPASTSRRTPSRTCSPSDRDGSTCSC